MTVLGGDRRLEEITGTVDSHCLESCQRINQDESLRDVRQNFAAVTSKIKYIYKIQDRCSMMIFCRILEDKTLYLFFY